MNDNKIALFFDKYAGIVIGTLIGLIILNFESLFDLFKFVVVVGSCAWLGNYIHKNKANVKEFLRGLIDKL